MNCPHMNVCFDLGVYSPNILHQFRSLDRLDNDTKIQDYINEDNLNSKLQILESTFKDISLTTMLKSQKNDTQYLYDNMVYEFFIGKTVSVLADSKCYQNHEYFYKYKSFDHLNYITTKKRVTNKEFKQCVDVVNSENYISLFENSCIDYR